jgi:hypothetical protein
MAKTLLNIDLSLPIDERIDDERAFINELEEVRIKLIDGLKARLSGFEDERFYKNINFRQ